MHEDKRVNNKKYKKIMTSYNTVEFITNILHCYNFHAGDKHLM